jgi:hypothetical protein
MENQSKYTRVPRLTGMTEIFTVIYDRNETTFDEFLYMEYIAIGTAAMLKWKIFKALPTQSIGPLMVCKN